MLLKATLGRLLFAPGSPIRKPSKRHPCHLRMSPSQTSKTSDTNRAELQAQQQPLKVPPSCTANGAHRHTGIHTHSSSRVRSRALSECIKALCSTTMVKAFPASRERFKRQDVKARTCGSLARRCRPWREFAYRELIKRTRRFFTLRKPSGKQDMEGGGGWGVGGGVAKVVVGVEGESSGAAPSPTASRYTEKPRRW